MVTPMETVLDGWVINMAKQGLLLAIYFGVLAGLAWQIVGLRRKLQDSYWKDHRLERKLGEMGIVVYTYKAKDGTNCIAFGKQPKADPIQPARLVAYAVETRKPHTNGKSD